jgi:vacuolar-type H+-ATPase subunit C/Vma6
LHLSEQILVDAYSSRDVRALIAALRTMPLPLLRSMAGERRTIDQLRLIQALLGEILEREARRALGGYPFTIGTVIAYFALVRAEAHAVRRILAGKSLGLPTERILRSVGI